jgi:hypothetical protein
MPQVTVVIVAGRLAAYGLRSCGIDTGTGTLVVRRLTDGHELHTFPATTSPAGPESYRAVRSVVLRPDGAVAWIGAASSIVSHRKQVEVNAATGATPRLLDKGVGIDPESLRLHGTRLTWSNGGRTRSASLQ